MPYHYEDSRISQRKIERNASGAESECACRWCSAFFIISSNQRLDETSVGHLKCSMKCAKETWGLWSAMLMQLPMSWKVCINVYIYIFGIVGFDGKASMVLVGTYSASCVVYCWQARVWLYSSFLPYYIWWGVCPVACGVHSLRAHLDVSPWC